MRLTSWFPLLFGSASAETPRSLREIELVTLEGARLDPRRFDGKVVLFVNVASRCGNTPQYEGLQALYASHKDRGFEIVGVPCNQFLWQEPGDAGAIAATCRGTYGVSFPILEKQDVNGWGRSPLYRWLVESPVGGGRRVRWNFEKFLVGRDGNVVGRFSPRMQPGDPELVGAVERALG